MSAFSLKGTRLLVVDDVETERMLITEYLQQCGARVFQAEDGLEGIHQAILIQPDLILMDADMPKCDGYRACRILSTDATTAHIPIVFLSALNGPEERVKGLLSGAVDYINKPFHFGEIRMRLVIHLNRRPEMCALPPASDISTISNTDLPESNKPQEKHHSSRSNLNRILFQSARIHLLKCLSSPPSLDSLAKLVGCNSKRLNAAFKACSGVTVFEYLREERMKEARFLLKETTLPVQDIAFQLGFTSGANFSTAFRERFGLSPTALR